jgi:hypothetical protein
LVELKMVKKILGGLTIIVLIAIFL